MYQLQDIVKPLTCPRFGDTDLHVTSTYTKGYAVLLLPESRWKGSLRNGEEQWQIED